MRPRVRATDAASTTVTTASTRKLASTNSGNRIVVSTGPGSATPSSR